MSASYVRDQIESFIAANAPAENYIDLTAEFRELDEMLNDYSIGRNDPWLGVQFIGNGEEPITVPATNDSGKYRELGVVYFHIVGVAAIGAGTSILSRAETLRNLLRGRRIGKIRVNSVAPPNFEAGATLQFEGGWTSASLLVDYEYDLDL